MSPVRPPQSRLAAATTVLACCLAVWGAPPPAGAGGLDLERPGRLQVGIGDRLTVERDGRWVPTVDALDRLGIDVDMLQIWLPRGWQDDWVSKDALERLHARGVVPVVVHYYFGDFISKERVEAQRSAWYTSMWEMAQQIRGDDPVLVVLEPEWNIAPPPGETAITDWPWFANDLRAAAIMIRKEAPNALIGTCPGDFPGRPNLEPVLGPVAADLDFLAFQEMRASTDPDGDRPGYTDVGRSAVEFARYLHRAFGRPLLLGYLAVSSYGGWVDTQRSIVADVHAHRKALLDAGVFGVVYFQLFDDRKHRGYFGPAEKHFGLIDAKGRRKPAFEAFRALAAPPAPPRDPAPAAR